MRMRGMLSVFAVFLCNIGFSQLVVNGENINDSDSIQYVQLSFYFNSKEMLPVYSVDFGDAVAGRENLTQTLVINNDTIVSQMTPIDVLNRLYHAGWEYLGDAMFMRAPLVENTQTYTLQRRKDK